MHGGVFGFFPEWKWQGYLLVDAWTYRTKPSRLLFLNGYEVLCHTRASGVLARIVRENSAMLDALRKAYNIMRYARESATFDALEWLLGVTFTPHEATVNPFARLIVFERKRPEAPPPKVEAERSRPPPPPLSAKSSWVSVTCVDDGKPRRPVPGVALEVVTASADVRTAYTNQDGVAYIDGIAPGRVSVRVLGRDGRTWRPLEGEAAAPCSSDERFTWHQVLRGECLSKIARRYSIEDWRDVWTFRKNEALRTQRKSPHLLHPGDMLAVPALQLYEIARETEQTHHIELDRKQVRQAYVLASHDLRFHAQSAVLLAQYTPESETEVRSDAPALDALATTLLHAEENPARPLLLVGHSEATETPEGDRKLSEVRAAGVRHMLRGDRDAWVALAREHSCSDDLLAILRWCAYASGWACAPAEGAGTGAESALRAFQEAYNQSHDAAIAEDGALGPETWGAIFDVYQHQLATRLETDAAGLETRQRALQFCEAAESYGCGSALSIHAESGAEGASFRRAEVQFFEPGEEPSACDLEQGQLAEPDFAFTPFALREAARTEVRVAVRELVYPGTEADGVPLEGKWLYAIADGSLAFSVEAASATEWQVTGPAALGPALVRDGCILLQAKQSYRFFLSPVPLTERAIDRLCSNLDACVWSTSVDRPDELRGDDLTLLVRDVFQWALDLHECEYLPKLDTWQSWLQDEERATRYFIASALKCIIDQGDEPGIRRHLRSGEPKKFLDQHAADEKDARGAAERAASQLASFVDCEDHRIIEQAHTDAGTEGVELAVVHWASVLGDLAQTSEGRQLLDMVAKDAERVPRKFVFADPPPLELGFSTKRYLGLAGRALLKELGQALIAHFYPKHTTLEAVARYLQRLGEAKPLLGTYRQIETNIKRGRKLTRKIKNKRVFEKLISAAKSTADAAYEARVPKGVVASQRLNEAYERALGKVDAEPMLVLEVINLALTLWDARDEDSDTPRLEKVSGVIGASADLGVVVLEAFELFKETARRKFKGALGIISGVCDAFAFSQSALRATDSYDYNQATGYGLAASGGVAVAVGSSLVLIDSIGGGGAAAAGAATAATAAAGGAATVGGAAAAGGWLTGGALLGVMGVVAMGAGLAVAALAADNAYQQFAKFCFLGDESGAATPVALAWSPVKLPARGEGASPALRNETAALITLLSSFELEFTSMSLVLHPRFYRAGDVFEIYVEVHPINYPKNACILEVDLESEQVTQLRGLRPLRDGCKVFKDPAGRITKIEIDLREAEPPSSPAIVQYHGGVARARLRFSHGSKTWFVPPVPPRRDMQPWVQVSANYGDLGVTLASTWRGSSVDEALHVDGPKQEVQPGMDEFHD